jgi:hypothetical protein
MIKLFCSRTATTSKQWMFGKVVQDSRSGPAAQETKKIGKFVTSHRMGRLVKRVDIRAISRAHPDGLIWRTSRSRASRR